MSSSQKNAETEIVAAQLVSPPPAKKLKQARLPFKVLSSKPSPNTVSPGNNNKASKKKRKLSEESNAVTKPSKTPKKDEFSPGNKKPVSKDEVVNEVSSSSEADHCKTQDLKSETKKEKTEKPKGATLLDKFVRTTQQGEVSTSCKEGVVDLTEDSNEATPKGGKDKEEKENCKEEKIVKKPEAKKTQVETVSPDSSEDKQDKTDNDKEETEEESKSEKDEKPASSPESSGLKPEDADGTDADDEGENDVSMVSSGECNASMLDSVTEADTEEEKSPTAAGQDKTPRSTRPSNSDKSGKKKAKGADATKKIEERERVKQEKLKQREEEKAKRQKEKEDKQKQRQLEKEQKDKEKQALKEKKEKERLAQKELKDKEKEEKQKLKDEEKQKKNAVLEAKNEEKRKKEEEKKKKEDEKKKLEEEQLKKEEKNKAMFAKFFAKKEKTETAPETENAKGPFIAFEVKKDMRLAPACRVDSTELEERKQNVETGIAEQTTPEEKLWVQQIKSKEYNKGKAGKTWPFDDNDVEVIEPDQESKPKKTPMRAKLLQFHENYRPAYYGTWRKKSKSINPKNPLKKDEDLLDYEVDSDDEWEEEEPGESLSHSEGEGSDKEEDKEDDDEEEADGFFVPHGYLSEGEGGEDDEEDGNPERMKARQLAKAKVFEAQMKEKCEVLHALYIGCIWWSGDKANNSPHMETLNQFRAEPLSGSFPISCEKAASCETPNNNNADSKRDRKSTGQRGAALLKVPDEAEADLVRLIHGSVCSIQKLMKEFREFWSNKCNPKPSETPAEASTESKMKVDGVSDKSESNSPSSSAKENKSESNSPPGSAKENKYLISKRQLDIKIRSIATYEKKEGFKKNCWYVNDDVRERLGLKDLPVPSEWQWTTRPNPNTVKTPGGGDQTPKAGPKASPAPTDTPTRGSIMQFAIPQSPSELNKIFPTDNTPKASPTPQGSPAVATTPKSGSKTAPKRIVPEKVAPKVSASSAFMMKFATAKPVNPPAGSNDAKPSPTPVNNGDCVVIDDDEEPIKLPTVAGKGQKTMKNMFCVKPKAKPDSTTGPKKAGAKGSAKKSKDTVSTKKSEAAAEPMDVIVLD